jgi:hypothetical protein
MDVDEIDRYGRNVRGVGWKWKWNSVKSDERRKLLDLLEYI